MKEARGNDPSIAKECELGKVLTPTSGEKALKPLLLFF